MILIKKYIIFTLILTLSSSFALANDCKKTAELYNKGTDSQNLSEKEILFKEALSLNCKDKQILAKVYNNLADTYEKQGRIEEAIAGYKVSIESDPELTTPYLSLGDIYFKKETYEYAIEHYEKGLSLWDAKLKTGRIRQEVLENLAIDMEEVKAALNKARAKVSLYRSKRDLVASLNLKSHTRAIKPVPSENLYFGFDQAEITIESKYQLEALLAALKDNELRAYRFQIAGHTCSTGSDAYNQGLSERRPRGVKEWLGAHGYPEAQLQTTGFGKNKPIADNSTEEGRRLNRRVEIRTIGVIVTDVVRSSKEKKGMGLLEKGNKLYNEGRYKEAAFVYQNALETFRESNFRDGIGAALGNLYMIYQTLGDHEKAQEYLKEFQDIDKRGS